jgi:hypothetical protein
MRRSHLPLRAPAMSFSGGHTLFPEGGTRPIRGNGSLPLVLDAWARVSTSWAPSHRDASATHPASTSTGERQVSPSAHIEATSPLHTFGSARMPDVMLRSHGPSRNTQTRMSDDQ